MQIGSQTIVNTSFKWICLNLNFTTFWDYSADDTEYSVWSGSVFFFIIFYFFIYLFIYLFFCFILALNCIQTKNSPTQTK